MTPEHRAFVQNVAPERNEQAPLGPEPRYDDVLDVAVQYTFPASDPVAVQSCCGDIAARKPDEPGGATGTPQLGADPSGQGTGPDAPEDAP